MVDSRKSWRVCLFEENHGSPAVSKVPIYSTELVVIRVNETKLTLGNAFILDLFALGGENESKYNARNPFLGLRAETWPVS